MTIETTAPEARPRPVLLPTPDGERIHALDALRGFAILGVLLAYTVWNLGGPSSDTWSAADRAIATGMDLLVDGKCLSLFAFLFGVGISQQWRRWQAAGIDPTPLHLRRMVFLLGVGLAHGLLLRNGDILAPYALLGLVLLLFRRAGGRVLAGAAVLFALAPSAIQLVVAATGWSLPARPGGGGGGYLAENFAWLRYWYMTNPMFGWPLFMTLMLAGVHVERTGTIRRLATDRTLALRALGGALALALVTRAGVFALSGASGEAPTTGLRIAGRLTYELSAWSLAAGYASALFLAMQSARVTAALRPLRAMGRMAFTNYLLQPVILVPACLAFGLFDTVTPTRGLLLALPIAVAQLLFSTAWLGRHPQGPLERLWRRFTYGAAARNASG